MIEVLILVILLSASFVFTKMICFLARDKQWYDIPNSRSSHSVPTPKGGGAAFVLVFSCAAIYMVLQGYLTLNEFLALGVSVLVAVLGFLDDLWNLSVKVRILTHLGGVLLVLFLLGGQPEIPFFSVTLNFGVLSYIAVVIVYVWLINLYNFMDGIDGLAALEGIFVSLAASFFAWQAGIYTDMFVLQSLAAAILGFSLLNLPPAKIFMGDVGSKFLGFVFGVLGLITINHGVMNVWTWSILLGVFVVDATGTLCRRFCSGEVWYHAHCSHAYQQAAIRCKSHGKVDLIVSLINCFWLFPLAWVTVAYESFGGVLTLLAYIPLIFLGHVYKLEPEIK